MCNKEISQGCLFSSKIKQHTILDHDEFASFAKFL